MFRFWRRFIGGRPQQAAPQGGELPLDEVNSQVATHFREIFERHGIPARPDPSGWTVFDGYPFLAAARIARASRRSGAVMAQLDVHFQIDSDRTLGESFVGTGPDLAAAANEALQKFILGSLHVLLAACFRPADDQITAEDWIIAGQRRPVLIGGINVYGTLPEGAPMPHDWFPLVHERVGRTRLSDDLHWLRVYYAQINGDPLAVEALLDNEPWPELQSDLAAYPWPKGPDYYAVRLFLMIAGAEQRQPRVSA